MAEKDAVKNLSWQELNHCMFLCTKVENSHLKKNKTSHRQALVTFHLPLRCMYTNGLHLLNIGIIFALDKGLKSVNCYNYPNFIQKAAFYPRKNSRHLQLVYVIKDTKIQTCFLNNVWIKSSFLFIKDRILLCK